MTHRLTTNSAKNYCNRTLIVKVIVQNVVTCFLGTQCRFTMWVRVAGVEGTNHQSVLSCDHCSHAVNVKLFKRRTESCGYAAFNTGIHKTNKSCATINTLTVVMHCCSVVVSECHAHKVVWSFITTHTSHHVRGLFTLEACNAGINDVILSS